MTPRTPKTSAAGRPPALSAPPGDVRADAPGPPPPDGIPQSRTAGGGTPGPGPADEASTGLSGAGTKPGESGLSDPARVACRDTGTRPGRDHGRTRPGQGLAAMAAAMSEDRGPDSLDAHVRKLMKDLGLWGFHVEKSLDEDEGRKNVSEKGWPDWTIIGTRIIYRELKTERGKVSREQEAVGQRIIKAGGDWAVWRPMALLTGQIQRELTAISGLRVAGGIA